MSCLQGEELDTGSPIFLLGKKEGTPHLSLFLDGIMLFDNLESKDSAYLSLLLLATHYIFNICYADSMQGFYAHLDREWLSRNVTP